jgi:hypothetical protein
VTTLSVVLVSVIRQLDFEIDCVEVGYEKGRGLARPSGSILPGIAKAWWRKSPARHCQHEREPEEHASIG